MLGSVLKEYLKNNYVLMTELPVVPNDLINEAALTTKLNDYAKAQDLQSYTTIYDFNELNDKVNA